jgi:hypothetical protein
VERRIDAQGRALKTVFIHIYDGKPHPTTGNPNYDATAYTRVDYQHREGRAFQTGEVSGNWSDRRSADGKTYTGTADGVSANSQHYNSVLVYDRQ